MLSGVVFGGILAAVVSVRFSGSDVYVIDPGPSAHDPMCAQVVSGLPQVLGGKERDDVSGAGAASWGSASIVLRCGVTPPGPTPQLCVSVGGVDWVLDEEKANNGGVRSLRTYGRSPAVEVTLNEAGTAADGILGTIGPAVRAVPRRSGCLSLVETAGEGGQAFRHVVPSAVARMHRAPGDRQFTHERAGFLASRGVRAEPRGEHGKLFT